MLLATAPITVSPYEFGQGPGDRDVVDLKAVARFIRVRWRLCLVWILAGLAGGIAFVMLAPGYYTAFATMLLEDRTARLPSDQDPRAVVTDPAYADSQIQVLQSDEVIARVVDQNGLAQVSEFSAENGSVRALASYLVSLLRPGLPATKPTSRHNAIAHVKYALTVQRIGLSNAVEIRFTSRDPLRAAAIANAIARSYIDGEIELKRQAREEAAARLRESLMEIRDKAFATEPPPQEALLMTPEAGAQAQARTRELQTRAETYRILYNNLLQRSYMESIDQSLYSGARVITSAEAPSQRSSPQAVLVLAIALVCGMAGGIGHALLKQATDHSLRTIDDVRQAIGPARVIAAPKVKRRDWKTGKPSQEVLQQSYVKSAAVLYDAIGKLAIGLQSVQGQRSGPLIGIVAAGRAAGASTIALHLSRIIAETGQKTLLIDANWQKPSIAKAMEDESPGRKLARALTTVHWETEKVDVLVLRQTVPISELNASLSIAAALQQPRTEHACVLVDLQSPEQTADLEASMVALGEIIIVAEAGRTSTESLSSILRMVPKDKIAAVVLNKV